MLLLLWASQLHETVGHEKGDVEKKKTILSRSGCEDKFDLTSKQREKGKQTKIALSEAPAKEKKGYKEGDFVHNKKSMHDHQTSRQNACFVDGLPIRVPNKQCAAPYIHTRKGICQERRPDIMLRRAYAARNLEHFIQLRNYGNTIRTRHAYC